MKYSLVLIFWRALALSCVALGLAGIVLPILPTVPFLIAAAWAGGKGWPRLEQWLLEHPRHGPAIRRWRDHRAVPRRAKVFALVMMTLSSVMLLLSAVALWVKVVVPAVMLVVGVWLCRHPER